MARFSLRAAVPDYLEFEAADGTTYQVNRVQHLSAMQQQSFFDLYRQISAAHVMLNTSRATGAPDVAASNQMLQALADFISLIAPAVPSVIRDAMTPDQHMALLEWWIAEHPEMAKNTAPSPKSSQPTTATPAKKRTKRG